MYNDYRLKVEVAAILEDFADLRIRIRFSEGMPNIEARDDIKITDTAPIVRAIDGSGAPATWCKDVEAGRDRMAGLSTISAQKAASSRVAAVSSSPMASMSSWTQRTRRKSGKTSGCSRRKVSPGFASAAFGGSIKMLARRSLCNLQIAASAGATKILERISHLRMEAVTTMNRSSQGKCHLPRRLCLL